MTVRPLMLLLALGIAVPLSGCDQIKAMTGDKEKKKSSDDDDDAKKKKKKKAAEDDEEEEAAASASAAASAAPAETAAPEDTSTATASADAAPTASDPAPAVPTPPGRSAVPTTEDWNGVAEATVLGSDKYGCETKALREWVRVSCSGEDPTRGKPTGVNITKGGGKGDTFTFAQGGIASLVYPFYEGQDLGATFSWEKHQHAFRAEWPRGAPQPTAYGIFQGEDAHLKPTPPTPITVPKPTATTPPPPPPPPPPPVRPSADPPIMKRPPLKVPIK